MKLLRFFRQCNPASLHRVVRFSDVLPMTEDSPKACDVVESWLVAHATMLGWKERKFGRSDTIAKFGAGYEAKGLLISVTAWDNASCFDIDIVDVSSGDAEMFCCRPTAGQHEIVRKLEALASRIESRASR
jgi:hypothetical protein